MDRRALLRVLWGATAVGTTGLSGCLNDSGPGSTADREPGSDGTPTPSQTATDTPTEEPRPGTPPESAHPGGTTEPPSTTERTVRTPAESRIWRSDVNGSIDEVRDGGVYGRGDLDDERSDGGVFRLGAGTGDVQWTYGSSGPYSSYTGLVAEDALYFGLGDDAIGSGNGELYAVEFDGSERWTLETGSVYDPPVLVDGVLYLASDDGLARAVDAADGSALWRTDVSEGDDYADPRALAAGGAVYVASRSLHALDRADGGTRWTYDLGGETISRLLARESVVFASTYDGILAVAGGEEQWRVDRSGYVGALVSGNLLVSHVRAVTAYDPVSGDEVWTVETGEERGLGLGDDVVYVGGERLTAVDAADGTESWSADVGPGRALEIAAVDGDPPDGTVVVASDGNARVVGFDGDGRETWTAPVAGEIDQIVATDRVYLSTSEGIVAVVPW